MKTALCVGLTLAIADCGPATASEAEFTQQMLERFQQQYPKSKFKAPENLTLSKDAGSGNEAHINLHRIWLYCKNVPNECERAKTDYVLKTNADLPAEAARGQLRLMVRGKEYIEHVMSIEFSTKSGSGAPAIYVQIGEDLYVVLAADYEGGIALVNEQRMQELNLTRDAAFSLAAQQTKPSLPRIPEPSQFKKQAIAFEGEAYVSALLYDRDSWRRIADTVGPDLLLTVVSDQFVFAGLMPDGPDLERFKQTVVEDCAQQERCISDKVYRFRNNQWVIAH